MTDVIMPKMGDAMEEGTLLEWLKGEGQKVKSGEVIGTIQTDKATLELEAPASGVLTGLLIKGGETVPVGQPIAAILKEGERLPQDWGKGSESRRAAEVTPPGPAAAPNADAAQTNVPANAPIELQQEAAADPLVPSGAHTEAGYAPGNPAVEREARTAHEVHTPQTVPAQPGRVKASPLARRIAKESGIDLATVDGSGPSGRVIEKDVRAAAERGPALAPAALATAPLGQDRVVQLNRLRQITAQRTLQSKQQVPHFYVTVEVDVERIMELREMFEAEESGKVSVNDFAIRACALALQDMPEVNATFQGQTVLQHGAVHIGIAAAIEEGLTVPVLKNANVLSLRQISARARELVKKAHENRLSLDELSGATFCISNMGMLDVDNFSAIIVQPNAAIVAISTARRKPVVNDDGDLEIRWRMNVTGSFDHRVVDGAAGARFMNALKAYLERPTRLLG